MQEQNLFAEEEDSYVASVSRQVKMCYRRSTEKYIFQLKERYLLTGVLYLIFIWRLISKQGFYVIAYILGTGLMKVCSCCSV
mgnify:CR=1 FL=1